MSYLRRITGPAALIALAVLWSNLWGQVRDSLSSSLFSPAHFEAYNLALNVPFQTPQLISAALAAAMVPVLVELYREGRTDEARRVSQGMVMAAAFVLLPLCLAGIALSGEVLRLWFWNKKDPATLVLATRLSQALFPYLLISGVSGAIAATLQSLQKFRILAIGQLLPNVIIVLVMVLFHGRLDVLSQALGVVLGGMAYFLLLVPYLFGVYRRDLRSEATNRSPTVPWWRLPAARLIFRAMLPVLLIGLCDWATGQMVVLRAVSWVQQANTADTASFKEFSNAYRILQIPQGLFVAAMATVLLPLLSQHAGEKDHEGLGDVASAGIRMVLYVVAPTAVCLGFLALPILNVLFRHGQFSQAMAGVSAPLVRNMAPYVLFSSVAEVLILCLLAMRRVGSLLAVQVLSLAAAVVFCRLFAVKWGVGGIAYAVSLITLINLILLLGAVERHIRMHNWQEMRTFIAKLGVACVGTGLSLSIVVRLYERSRAVHGLASNSLEILIGVG
ncbi:MAG: MATE family efflux transporter, partial [Armatimonadota bacterium]|nr:MATE family efflux transporter [Armatimonadota bacterium]